MNTRLKTRSDYHEGFHPHHTGYGLNRWAKPLLWLVLGIALGISYNKKDLHSCQLMLAQVESGKQTAIASTELSTQGVAKEEITSKV